MKKEYIIDDRIIIPDHIKNMTKEELEAEIKRLEAEARQKNNQMSLKVAL